MRITNKEYIDLINDRTKLRALEAAGVDNWEGYEIAMEYSAFINDMNDFIGDNWEAFQDKMALLGFTDEQVDELSEELTEFLFNTGEQIK